MFIIVKIRHYGMPFTDNEFARLLASDAKYHYVLL
jgi:hypothetical protein